MQQQLVQPQGGMMMQQQPQGGMMMQQQQQQQQPQGGMMMQQQPQGGMMQSLTVQTGGGAQTSCAYEGAHNMLPPSDCGKCCCNYLELYRYDGCDCSMLGLCLSGCVGSCILGTVGSIVAPPVAPLCSSAGNMIGGMTFMCESPTCWPANLPALRLPCPPPPPRPPA